MIAASPFFHLVREHVVPLPKCRRCGKQDPQRMHGLMSLWFAPLIELEADLGYFYLCPACHDEIIVPELERIQNRILELHPAAQRALDHEFGEVTSAGDPEEREELDAAGEAETAKEAGAADEAETAEEAEGPDEAAGSDEAGAADAPPPDQNASDRDSA